MMFCVARVVHKFGHLNVPSGLRVVRMAASKCRQYNGCRNKHYENLWYCKFECNQLWFLEVIVMVDVKLDVKTLKNNNKSNSQGTLLWDPAPRPQFQFLSRSNWNQI